MDMHNISEVKKSTNLMTSCILYSSMAHQRIIIFHFCVFSSPAKELLEIILKSLKLILRSKEVLLEAHYPGKESIIKHTAFDSRKTMVADV